MTDQPFPGLNSKVLANDGTVSPVWRAFFQALWSRSGGAIATGYALVAGSASQGFKAAPASTGVEVVTLGQANARYQPLGDYALSGGNPSQPFEVADAVDATGAVSLQQAQAADAVVAANAAAATALKANAASPVFTGTVGRPVYTVAGLPAGAAGKEAYVTDAVALVFGGVPTGGGALGTPVSHDGTNWRMG